jgi:hypothetical protein
VDFILVPSGVVTIGEGRERLAAVGDGEQQLSFTHSAAPGLKSGVVDFGAGDHG